MVVSTEIEYSHSDHTDVMCCMDKYGDNCSTFSRELKHKSSYKTLRGCAALLMMDVTFNHSKLWINPWNTAHLQYILTLFYTIHTIPTQFLGKKILIKVKVGNVLCIKICC